MHGWFGGGVNVSGMNVLVTTQSNGASWNGSASSSTIQLNAQGASYSNNPAYLRYLLIAEVVEIFMMAQNIGWFQGSNEGSKGEDSRASSVDNSCSRTASSASAWTPTTRSPISGSTRAGWTSSITRQTTTATTPPWMHDAGVRHGWLRHLAAVIEPQPEVSKMTIDTGLKAEGRRSAPP